MNARRELFLMVGTLQALLMLLAFGSIGLFARMGPAIERIIEANVETMATAEQILARIAQPGEPGADAREQFDVLLERIENNITEDAEHPPIALLKKHMPGAVEGNAAERQIVIEQLLELSQVNREAMLRVDREAQRLGNAGSWAAVFIGFIAFCVGLLTLRRINGRFVDPIEELDRVLAAARSGDRFRRCGSLRGPLEIGRSAEAVDWLLEELGAHKARAVDALHETTGKCSMPSSSDHDPSSARPS